MSGCQAQLLQRFHRVIGASTALLTLTATSAQLVAQAAPQVFFACYAPLSGTVYRIKDGALRTSCYSTTHVEFSWTDGANAVRTTDPLGGDLSGVFSNANVVKLLGRTLSTTPPETGQVLSWNGTAWVPTTPASGGGTSDHGALTGLGDDDHAQYLLANGLRGTTDGFAVTGTFGVGSMLSMGHGPGLLWYPAKAAFRAGFDTAPFAEEIGAYSVAMGRETTAMGEASTAFGRNTWATASGSTAMGFNTRAEGVNSMASGTNSVARGESSFAGGEVASAIGLGSFAFGPRAFTGGVASVALGSFVEATGQYAVALGQRTSASGDNSVALGQFASTNFKAGSFVFGDASSYEAAPPLQATRPNQFVIRAQHFWLGKDSNVSGTSDHFLTTSTGAFLSNGGAWTNASDRALKHAFADTDGEDVLRKIVSLPIRSWSYKAEDPSVRHVGPTAQDFRATFGLGNAETSIATIDADGISLLGIQTLEKRTRERQRDNQQLRAVNQELQTRLEQIEALLKRLENR